MSYQTSIILLSVLLSLALCSNAYLALHIQEMETSPIEAPECPPKAILKTQKSLKKFPKLQTSQAQGKTANKECAYRVWDVQIQPHTRKFLKDGALHTEFVRGGPLRAYRVEFENQRGLLQLYDRANRPISVSREQVQGFNERGRLIHEKCFEAGIGRGK